MAPSITVNCPGEVIQGEEIDLYTMVSASDNCDGDIADKVQIEKGMDTNVPGVHTVPDNPKNPKEPLKALRGRNRPVLNESSEKSAFS